MEHPQEDPQTWAISRCLPGAPWCTHIYNSGMEILGIQTQAIGLEEGTMVWLTLARFGEGANVYFQSKE